MSGNGFLGIKSIALMIAAATMSFAGFQAEPGGRFDRLTKVRHKPGVATLPRLRAQQIAYAGDGGSDATVTNTTQPNLPYSELSAIPSNFDINAELDPAAPVVPQPANEDVGAFRFLCTPGQVTRDDPIVYPGQRGMGHLHQFFGNTAANANSTYQSLRTTGESTCVSKANRSAYWMPAMLDGHGSVVRPDYVVIYYKRTPISDPRCSLTSGDPHAFGNCIPLPNGLRFIFGYDMVKGEAATPLTGRASFDCDGPSARSTGYATFQEAIANCPLTPGPNGEKNRIAISLGAPMCWDGKNLDSPNHKDHMGYGSYGWWGYYKCDQQHPFVIPSFTMKAWYTVDENLKDWHLSSDEMHPELPAGATAHADWFGGWDNTVEAMWMDNCINRKLNCSTGELGNLKILRQTPNPFPWLAIPRLVPAS